MNKAEKERQHNRYCSLVHNIHIPYKLTLSFLTLIVFYQKIVELYGYGNKHMLNCLTNTDIFMKLIDFHLNYFC
jgi:hypothetical protein